jgi:hypothetical protein
MTPSCIDILDRPPHTFLAMFVRDQIFQAAFCRLFDKAVQKLHSLPVGGNELATFALGFLAAQAMKMGTG